MRGNRTASRATGDAGLLRDAARQAVDCTGDYDGGKSDALRFHSILHGILMAKYKMPLQME